MKLQSATFSLFRISILLSCVLPLTRKWAEQCDTTNS